MNEVPSANTMKRRLLAAGALGLAASVAIGLLARSISAPRVPGANTPVSVEVDPPKPTAEITGAAATANHNLKSFPIPEPHARRTSAPLPPPGTPLAQIYDGLKARADAGDAPAASRLYREVTSCVTARLGLPNVRSLLKGALAEDFSNESADRISKSEKYIASLQQQMARYEAADGLCGDLTGDQLQMIPVSLRAAQLGDTAAASCYIRSPMFFMNGLLDHPEWITQYKQNALALANAAVENGDWEMVLLLRFAYTPPMYTDGNLLSQVTGTDPAMAYRYAKLGELGSRGTTPVIVPINSSTSAVLGSELPRFETLSAEAIAAGDAWAEDAFRRFFGSVPRNDAATGGMDACRPRID